MSTTLPIGEAITEPVAQPSSLEHDRSAPESFAGFRESEPSGNFWTPEHDTTDHSEQFSPGEKTLVQVAAGLEDFKKRVDKLEASSSSCPHCLGMSAQIQNGVEDAVSNVESRAEDHHQVQTEILQTRIEGLESQHRAQKSDCSNCHVLRAKIDEIEQKLHDQENRSKFLEAEAVARESQAEDFLEELRQRLQNRIDELESQKTIPAYPPSYCNNCDFVSSKIYKARKKSKEFEEKMIRAENKLRGHYHEVDEARKEVYKVLGDLGKAEREIERFRSELDRVKAAASGTRGV